MNDDDRYPYPKLAPQPGDTVFVWIDGIEQAVPAVYREQGEKRWFDLPVRCWTPRRETPREGK